MSGPGNIFPSAALSSWAQAEVWIGEHRLTGTPTAYPMDAPVDEWALDRGLFKPKVPSQSSPEFIARFSSAYLEHSHYEDGVRKT